MKASAFAEHHSFRRIDLQHERLPGQRALPNGRANVFRPPCSGWPSHRVEVAKDLPRLRALTGTDVAALLEDIEDAGGAGVAEAQAALEERGAGLFLLPHHFEALLHEFLVFAADFFLLAAGCLAEA